MVADVETLTGDLSGEVFLQDFKKATEMADAVGLFESWVLAGDARRDLVEQVRQNPVVAEEQLAVDGLANLLGSVEEKELMQELVEKARKLDIARFLGYKATVTQHERGSGGIRKYSVSNPIANGMRYLPGPPILARSKTAKLTSLSPANQSFRIGEYRNLAVPWRMTAFWEVHPFDKETGEPVVDVALQGARESMPSRQYVEWWNANRA